MPFHDAGRPLPFIGVGYGGQYPIVIPEHDLIVVWAARIHGVQPEESTWQAVQAIILPVLGSTSQG